jgi:hypothetical protein
MPADIQELAPSINLRGAAVGGLLGVSVAEKNLTFGEQAARMASTLHAARPLQSVSTVVYQYF